MKLENKQANTNSKKEPTILSPCLFNIYRAHLGKCCAGGNTAEFKRKIEISIKISITSDMQMIPPIWHKAKITKEPLDVGERGE